MENQITYRECDHEPTITSEQSAEARGEDIKIGGKTLLMKDKADFRLFVLSAAKQADSQKMRKILGSQKLRFATPDELLELAGVTKGALPPFGRPILPYDLYVDESIMENEKIAFNAGVLTKSIIMSVNDWRKIIDFKLCDFTKECT